MKNIGVVEDFPLGKNKPVKVDNKTYLIWRTKDEFYATRSKCPHQGASFECVELSGTMIHAEEEGKNKFEYCLEDRVIRCPWHRWEFDVKDGNALFGTDHRRINTYPIVVKGNEVYLDI